MKKVIALIILIIFCLAASAQNLTVECGASNVIEHKTITVVDTLKFTCARILLIQDSSVLYLYSVDGIGLIKRGALGGAPRINGIRRFEGDEDPLVILIGCSGAFSNLEIGDHIDVVHITDLCND